MFKNKRLAIVVAIVTVGGTAQLSADDIIWWLHRFVFNLKTRNLSTVRDMRAAIEVVEEAQKRAEENLKKNDKDLLARELVNSSRECVSWAKAQMEAQDLTLRDMQYTEWQFLWRQISGTKSYTIVQQQVEMQPTVDINQITLKPSIIGNQTKIPKTAETQKPVAQKPEAPRVQPTGVKMQPKAQMPTRIGADHAVSPEVYEQQHSGAPDGGMK